LEKREDAVVEKNLTSTFNSVNLSTLSVGITIAFFISDIPDT
jgi:hypothetical protein